LPIDIDDAKRMALERVKNTRDDATADLRVDDVKLQDQKWIVSGSWDATTAKSSGRMGFDLELDSESGAIFAEKYAMRPGYIGVG
jgi:hypothetical protein